MKVFVASLLIVILCCSIALSLSADDDDFNVLDTEDFKKLVAKESAQTVPDMIRQEGYRAESHFVTTPDGYILNLHRIPRAKNGKRNGKVAFLQHGLLASSAHWVLTGSNGKSLAYNLADAGYDVWMGNARGNTYSRNHTTLDPDKDKAKFWKFSWHEIGTTDLPTMIDYVLAKTKVKGVYYAGHSQGTTAFYVMTSIKPEYNNKIKTSVSLAPIAFMNHMTSPLMRIMAFWEKPAAALGALIGVNEFLPSDGFLGMLSSSLCSNSVGQILCKNSLFAICGFSNEQVDKTTLSVMMAHSPAGASTRQLFHYAQEIKSGKFRWYDLGTVQNKITYGSLTPPNYDLSKIAAPVYLIYSLNDWLAAVKDVNRLSAGLPNLAGKILVADTKFNHLDFVMGKDAPTLVYSHVLDMFAKH